MGNIAERGLRACITSLAVLFLTTVPTALAADHARPYGGSCDAVVEVLTLPGVFPQELSITLDCNLKHLGRASGLILQTVTPTGISDSTVLIDIENVTIYAAPNGDTLESTQVGVGTIDLVTGAVDFALTETFTGGSGRFADASGSSLLVGKASIFTNLGFFRVSGQITY